MIKIIKEGQKAFTRTCDRCGCKFQYDLSDLSGLDYISCPYCHTTLAHIGPHPKKVGPNDTDLSKINFIPNGYQPLTGSSTPPPPPTTGSNVTKANLPDDIVDDPYNNIGMQLPDNVKDNCCYVSDGYKAWYEKWCKLIKEKESIKCKK